MSRKSSLRAPHTLHTDHTLPAMARRSSVTNGTVFLVGPPRVRQHRAGAQCDISPEWANGYVGNSSQYAGELKGPTCWVGTVEETPKNGEFASANSNFSFTYNSAAELEEVGYSTVLQAYSGNGYILRNMSNLLKRVPTRHAEGSELYQYAHSRLDLDDLHDSGWLSPSTTAIFHDFTLFSAGANAYVTVRLVAEIKLDNQIVVPTKHVQVCCVAESVLRYNCR